MAITAAQFGSRADPSLRHPPVGPLRADLEAARQAGAWQRQRHPVADREIDGPADHAARLAVPGGHLAVPDRLLEPGQLLDPGDLGYQHAVDIVANLLDGLDLETGGGEPPGNLIWRGSGCGLVNPGCGQQPGQWP